jgi:histidyl-tRNA synthetase
MPALEPEFRPKPRRARGIMDRRGPALAAERALIAKIAKVYEAWGFEPLETPALEYADTLGKFLPDQDRPNEGVFALEDDDAQWLALRYDLTAPLARYVAENFDALPKPYRRWAAGPVWRNEKPGPGRFREFWQCDADTVGSASPAADAEMIAMACAALEAAGIARGSYVVNVNDRRLLEGLFEKLGLRDTDYSVRLNVMRAIDKRDRLGVDGVRLLLGPGRKDESGDFTRGANLTPDQAEQVIRFTAAGFERDSSAVTEIARVGLGEELDRNSAILGVLRAELEDTKAGAEALTSLRQIHEVLETIGLGEDQWLVDPSVIRGLEYYTGTVFEAQLIGGEGASLGSVGGGGRYDDLVARFRGEAVPATGFSIGVSRLAAALEAAGGAEAAGPVVVLAMERARMAEYFAMAAELRAGGVRAEVYLGAGGVKAQMKYADKRGAPVAVICGGDEFAKGVVTLKDLKLGAALARNIEDNKAWREGRPAQIEAPRADLAQAVRAMLGGQG